MDIRSLTEVQAYEILKHYLGENSYILYLKKQYITDNNFKLTKQQATYITQNKDFKERQINKIVEISNYLGDQLKSQHELNHKPERILVESLMGTTEKTFHVKVKLHKNDITKTIWLPKSQISEDLLKKEVEIDVDWSKYDHRPPMEYQKEGIVRLLQNDRYILAFTMGLGKTLVSILAALESGAERILVVCPASLKLNWKKEIAHYWDINDVAIVDSKSEWIPKKFNIINYDILHKYHDLKDPKKSKIIEHKIDLVIADEAHFLKEKSARRTKTFNAFARIPQRVWLLTGTPITNKPLDLFNLLSICNHPLANDWMMYAKTYCNAKRIRIRNRFIWNMSGSSNLDELHRRTKNVMFRKKKEDVLDLPKKMIIPLYFELNDKKGYHSAVKEYIEWRKEQGKNISPNNKLVQLSVLRRFVAENKVESSIEIANKALEEDKKVIIFTNYTGILQKFVDYYKDSCVYLDGSMNSKQRQQAVDSFQEDPNIKVFVGNIVAAGTGITLTRGQVSIFNDLHFTPAIHMQAEDRNHRYGVEQDITIYYPLFEDTVDTTVYNVLNKKKHIIDLAIEGINVEEENSSALSEIINDIERDLGLNIYN